MSREVDEKVVSMRFDNKHFEANVKTSMNTIDNLKKSLNFEDSVKGLDKMVDSSKDKYIDAINQVTNSLRRVTSPLREIRNLVIGDLYMTAKRLQSKATSFITQGIIGGGKRRAMNLENAHFQLQGLLKDEEAVSAVMQNVSDSVDGTAYSLDAAAKVASQLAASGMRAGDGMFKSLRAVAGVAAMTNSEYDEIGRIFTQVAGNGRLMGDQLLQLSSRGMNAAATLAKALGVTEGEVRDMVSKGKIDFETFANAMDDAFGEHAKKANETLTGAFSNVKAALGRIGALFFSPLVEQNGELVQLLNAVRIKINEIKGAIGPVADFAVNAVKSVARGLTDFVTNLDVATPFKKLSSLVGNSKWSSFVEKINDAGVATDKFQESLKAAASKQGISLDDLIKKYGSLERVVTSGELSNGIIVNTLNDLAIAQKQVAAATDDSASKLSEFQDVVRKVIRGDFGNGSDRMERLADAGYDYVSVQKLINYIWARNDKNWKNQTISVQELSSAIGDLTKTELKSIGVTEEQAKQLKDLAVQAEEAGTPINELINGITKPTAGQLVFDTLRNVLSGFMSVLKTFRDAWTEVFDFSGASGIIYEIIAGLNRLSKSFVLSENRADKLRRTFKGLFAILDIARSVVSSGLNIAFKLLKAVLSAFNLDLLDFTAFVGDAVVKLHTWLEDNNLLQKAIERISPIIQTFSEKVSEAATAAYSWAKNNEVLKVVFEKISEWAGFAIGKIKEWSKLVGPAMLKTVKWFGQAAESVYFWFKNGQLLNTVLSKFSKWIKISAENIKNWFSNFKDADKVIKTLWDGISKGFISGISTIAEIGRAIVTTLVSSIREEFERQYVGFSDLSEGVVYSIGDGVKTAAGYLGKRIKSFFLGVADIINKIDVGALLMGAFTGTILYLIDKTLNTVAMFAAPMKAIAGMFTNIGAGIKQMSMDIGSYFRAKTFASIGKTILNFAYAIGILAASIIGLGLAIHYYEGDIWKGLGIVVALSGIMVALAVLANKSGKDATFRVSANLISIAIAMGILAIVFQKMSKISWEEFKVAAGAITILGVIMISLIAVSKKSSDVKRATRVLKEFSGLIVTLAIITWALSRMDPDKLKLGLLGIVGIAGTIIIMIEALKRVKNDAPLIGDVLLEIAGAMAILGLIAKAMGKMDPSDFDQGLGGLAGLMTMIITMVAVLKRVDKELPMIGKTLIEIAGAMAILALVLIRMAKFSQADGSLTQGFAMLLGLEFAVLVLVEIVKRAEKDAPRMGKTLLAIAGAMTIMSFAAKVLATMSFWNMAKGIAGLLGLSLAIGILIKMTQKAKQDSARINITLLSIAGSVALLSAIATLLGLIKMEHLIKGVAAVAVLGLIMARVLDAASDAKDAQGPLLAMAGVIAMISTALYLLSKTDNIDKALKSVLAIGTLLLTLAVVLGIASKYGDVQGGLGLLAASGALIAIAGALWVLAQVPSDNMGKSLLILAGALLAICLTAALFKAFAVGAGLLVAALLSIAAVITSVGLAALAFAGALYIVGLALPLLGEGLKSFITSLIGCKDMVGEFIIVCWALALAFIPLAVVFVVAAAGVALLGAALLIVAAAALAFSLAILVVGTGLSLIGGGLTAIGTGLENFVNSINNCKDSVDGFGETLGKIATAIASALSMLADGLFNFAGSALLAGIGAIVLAVGVAALAAALIVGALAVGLLALAFLGLGAALDVTREAVTAGRDLVLGFANGIVGAISNVLDVVKNFCSTVINKFCEIFGIHSPSTVFMKIAGHCIDGYKKGLDDGKSSVEESAAGVANAANEGLANADADGGSAWYEKALGKIKDTVAGDGTLEEITGNFGNLGSDSGISFMDGFDGSIDPSQIEGVLANGTGLEGLSDTFGSAGSKSGANFISGLTGEVNNVDESEIVGKFTSLGSSSGRAFTEGLKQTLDLTPVTNVEIDNESIDKKFFDAGTYSGNSFMSALSKALTMAAKSVPIDGVIYAISSYDNHIQAAGEELGQKFAIGMKSKTASAKSIGAGLALSAVAPLQSPDQQNQFRLAGIYLADGLIKGMKEHKNAVYMAAYDLGQAAVNGELAGQRSKSPSKLMVQAGKWLGEGLIIGMDRMGDSVYNSGKSLGAMATGTISNAIAKIADYVDSDIDADPVIRPVVDLSNVTAGVNAINNAFGINPAMDVMSNINAISSMMNTNQNGANDDVVSAIRDLGKKIGESSGTTNYINGITYDDGSNVSEAVRTLVRAAQIERRS